MPDLKSVMGLRQQFVDRIRQDVLIDTLPPEQWRDIADDMLRTNDATSFQFSAIDPDGTQAYVLTIAAFPLDGHPAYRGMGANRDGIVTPLEPDLVEAIYKKYDLP